MTNRTPWRLSNGQGVQFKSGDTVDPVFGGTGISSYHIGDLLVASSTVALAPLAAVAVGNVMLSGGVDTLPLWGKLDLAVHVAGVLLPVNGGTGIASYTSGNYINAASSSTLQQRSPSQVLSDIGAAPVIHQHSGADITSGTVAPARLGSGAPSSANFLRGDGAWSIPSLVLGNVSVSIGSTTTVLTGFSSVTSTTFVGALSGNASTATNATTATNANNVAITNDNASATALFPVLVSGSTGNLPTKTSSGALQYIPSTGTLSATVFQGRGQFSNLSASGITSLTNTTESTDLNTASVVMAGGLAVTKSVRIGGDLYVEGVAHLGETIGDITEIGVIAGLTTFSASTASTTSNQIIASVDGSVYRSAEFRVQAVDLFGQKYHTATILVVHDGSTADFVEFGASFIGDKTGTFSVNYSNGTFVLMVTPDSSNLTTYKIVAMLTKL